MNKFTAYLRESYTELTEKVSWPRWNNLTQSTVIVLGATAFITGLVWVMDVISNGVMKSVYSLFE